MTHQIRWPLFVLAVLLIVPARVNPWTVSLNRNAEDRFLRQRIETAHRIDIVRVMDQRLGKTATRNTCAVEETISASEVLHSVDVMTEGGSLDTTQLGYNQRYVVFLTPWELFKPAFVLTKGFALPLPEGALAPGSPVARRRRDGRGISLDRIRDLAQIRTFPYQVQQAGNEGHTVIFGRAWDVTPSLATSILKEGSRNGTFKLNWRDPDTEGNVEVDFDSPNLVSVYDVGIFEKDKNLPVSTPVIPENQKGVFFLSRDDDGRWRIDGVWSVWRLDEQAKMLRVYGDPGREWTEAPIGQISLEDAAAFLREDFPDLSEALATY